MNDHLTAFIKSEYGLSVSGLRPLSGGYVHDVWRAASDRGPIVVKRYQSVDPKQLQKSLELQQAACTAGLPVPTVFANLKGQLATKTAHGWVTVQERLNGAHRDPAHITPALAASVGRTLGRVHRMLAEIPPPKIPIAPPSEDKIRADSEDWLNRLRAVSNPDEWDRMAANEAEYRLRALSSHAIDPARYAIDVPQWIHGDFYPANLLFDEQDRVVAVLDWDFATYRHRGVEVARAAFEFARTGGGSLVRSRFDSFLSAYAGEASLSAAQRAIMFHQFFHHQLSVLYPLVLRRSPGAHLPKEWQALARRRFEVVRDIERNLDLMTEWASMLA